MYKFTAFAAAAAFATLSTTANAAPVYLNDSNISVSLGNSHGGINPFNNGMSIAVALANAIDAPSADASENHFNSPTGTHLWTTNALELDFDFAIEYDLSTLHFWNYNAENYDVDNIDFNFYDGSNALVGTLNFLPNMGTPGALTAQDYALSFPSRVRYVNALFSGTNDQVDFNNIGFTAQVSPPVATVPLPAAGLLLIAALAGAGALRRRS